MAFLFAPIFLQLLLILMIKISVFVPIAAMYLLIGLLVALKSPEKLNGICLGRTMQLVAATQFFVLSVLLTVTLLSLDWAIAAKRGPNLFVLYFVLQAIGFIYLCLKKKNYMGVTLTALFASCCFYGN